MFRKIAVPVDLAHLDQLGKSLTVAADLSRHYDAPVLYVGVTTEAPSEVAHTPAEFKQRLEAFTADQQTTHGHTATSVSYASHDPAADLNETLLSAIAEADADLVVIAAYVPSLAKRLRRSHEGAVVARSQASVFVIR